MFDVEKAPCVGVGAGRERHLGPGEVCRSTTRWLGHGVGLTSIVDPRGPYRIKVLSVKLERRSTIDVALSNNVLPDFETTSSMARRHGALAAVNGDYAQPDGRPVYGFAEEWTPPPTGAARDRRRARAGL